MVRQANILIKTTVERKWKDFPKISKCGCWGKLNCHTRWIATNKLMAFISRVRKNRFLLFNYFSFCTRNKELHVPKSSPDTSKSFSNTTFVWIRINWEHSECTQSLYDWIRSLNIYQEFICVIHSNNHYHSLTRLIFLFIFLL